MIMHCEYLVELVDKITMLIDYINCKKQKEILWKSDCFIVFICYYIYKYIDIYIDVFVIF